MCGLPLVTVCLYLRIRRLTVFNERGSKEGDVIYVFTGCVLLQPLLRASPIRECITLYAEFCDIDSCDGPIKTLACGFRTSICRKKKHSVSVHKLPCVSPSMSCLFRSLECPKCPSINGLFFQSLRPLKGLLLVRRLLKCSYIAYILRFSKPVRLDLEKISSFMDGH
jgi:hypothetical protein